MNTPYYETTEEVKTLARAVLDNDTAAAAALHDWLCENITRRVGRFSVNYVEKLEDTLVEIKKLACVGTGKVKQQLALNKIYALCYQTELFARSDLIGRQW